MRTIGFAGTAKNTGKTTTASAVLQAALAAGLTVALTSIGYDGEAVDTVTGLPKPRYFLPAGVLVATADRCLAAGSAGCEILASTGIATILGEIRLARVTQPGLVLLAGPNRRADLERVLAASAACGASLALVDGALNRLVPLSGAGGLVLSTGAAWSVEPDQVAAHAAALVQIFSLPVVEPSPETEAIRWTAPGGRSGSAAAGSLIGAESYQAVSESLPAAVQQLTIPGACDPVWLERLLNGHSAALRGAQLVFGHPFHLVAGGDPLHWQAVFTRLAASGGRAAVQASVPLLCLTVNPFFPRYHPGAGRYSAGSVDAQALLHAVRKAVPGQPVVDVCQPDRPDLLTLLGIVPQEQTDEP